MKEKGTCGSHLKNNNKKINKNLKVGHIETRNVRFFYFYFIFFSRFSLRYMEIGPSEFVGQRKQSAILDEGYAYEPKTQDFAEFSIKNSENLIFWFFSDLRLSDG